MAWPLVIAGALTLASGVYKGIQASNQRKQLMGELESTGTYKENPLAKQMLGYASNLYSGRMVGATNAEQNILANRANTLASVERSATDSSQVLAAAANSQQISDMSINQLGELEARDRLNRYGMLQDATQGVINEQDKAWNDKIRVMNSKMAIYGVDSKNRTDAADTAASGLTSIGMGLYGKYNGGLYGK